MRTRREWSACCVTALLHVTLTVLLLCDAGSAYEKSRCLPTPSAVGELKRNWLKRVAALIPSLSLPGSDLHICRGDVMYPSVDKLSVSGRVVDDNCEPLSNTLIKIIQRDSRGHYTGASRCDGAVVTDASGFYTFTTEVPGSPLLQQSPSIEFVLDTFGRTTLITSVSIVNPLVTSAKAGVDSKPRLVIQPLFVDNAKTLHYFAVFDFVVTTRADHLDGAVLSSDSVGVDKRAWSKANRGWLKKKWGDSVNWLPKDNWDSNTISWLKRSVLEPAPAVQRPSALKRAYTDWMRHGSGLYGLDGDSTADWSGKRGWGSKDISWLKKRNYHTLGGAVALQKRMWGDSDMEWVKRTVSGARSHAVAHHVVRRSLATTEGNSDIDSSAVQPGRVDTGTQLSGVDKRGRVPSGKNWSEKWLNWLKSNTNKKNWGESGMTWVKRGGQKRNWDNLNMAWIKKNWGDSGMSWIKRNMGNNPWANVDNSWIKRSNWKDSGMSWIKKDADKKNWKDSGMSWIKKDVDKKNWKDSGMSWIKKDADKKNWKDSGMSWIKKDADKKNWKDSGMSWIKKDADKKNWKDSGMSWIKKDADKKNWKDSGMSWIKKDADKKNWKDSGMSWIKKDADKKNWKDFGHVLD
ncbi:hypothetical protein NP493_791g01025 [Ridgeia piscesae]|uniref:Intradiol ring-cleavage dioxygenases domain-containing protein n=1 Tax=Ridgeia piscesae TaxID=27915 RepID=A0AAD9KNT5_RIDPI|nr:hypothetical protein NP493_791g01025 [Ridgeia piscesae]